MILFHGSDCVVESPSIERSRRNVDFGRGFYLTSYREQAENWARRKALRSDGVAIVNEFEFDDSYEALEVLRFEEADAKWVEFVCDCRRGGTSYQNYDLIVGGVADDKVFRAVSMYFRGFWDMETTLEALRYYDVNDQWCFTNQSAVDLHLSFLRWYEVV